MVITPAHRSSLGIADHRSPAPTAAWALPTGLAGGLVLGVAARLWMRLISGEPEFSWSGTLFIVVAFGLFGLGQAVSWSSRRAGRGRRRTTVARAVGVVLTLPLFAGAGAIMLPTVLTASLASWRTDWSRTLRVIVGALALPVVVVVAAGIVDELGWGVRALGGIIAFVAIYGLVVAALRPTAAPLADGWRLPRLVRTLAVASIGLLVAFAVVTVVGL